MQNVYTGSGTEEQTPGQHLGGIRKSPRLEPGTLWPPGFSVHTGNMASEESTGMRDGENVPHTAVFADCRSYYGSEAVLN